MKRKLALLLAGTMALSTVPSIDAFAGQSSIGKGLIITNPKTNTLYVGGFTPTTSSGALTTPVGNVTEVAKSSIMKFKSDATIQEGSLLQVELQNARWATDEELTAANGGVITTLLDEINNSGAEFADAVTSGLDIRRLNDTTILIVSTSTVAPAGSTSIAVPADFVPTSESGEITAKVTNTNLPGIPFEPIKLSRNIEDNTGVTANVTEAKQATQVRAENATISLTENVQGQFLPNSTYTITLPSGYYFDAVAPAQLTSLNTAGFIQAKAGTDWATTGNVIEYSQPTPQKIEIHFSSDYNPAYSVSSLGSIINISGLAINNSIGNYNNDVMVNVYGNGVSQSSKIARFGTFSVKAETIGDVPTLQAGTTAQNKVVFGNTATGATKYKNVNDYTIIDGNKVTNTLKITENIAGSFRGGDIVVTFPNDIDVTGVQIVSATSNTLLSGINPSDPVVAQEAILAPAGYTTITDGSYTGLESTAGNEYKYIEVDGNEVTFRGLASNTQTDVIDLRVKFELSAESDYQGDVSATISSSNSIDIATPIMTGRLATFESVVNVDANVKSIPVGYSSQQANDITITETKSNTFKSGEEFTIKLSDEFDSAGYGITSAKVDVVGGNLEVEDVTIVNRNTADSEIRFTVNGVTTGDDLGQIKVTDVMVYSDRSVPIYNADNVVDVEISSTETLTMPITKEYIRFTGENDVITGNELNKDVVLYMGQDVAYVGNETIDLLGSPYISADGNTMVPVKGTGYALGIEETNVIYDPVLKEATFILPNGKIAQITANSPYAKINGSKVPLIDAKGKLVAPVIKEGRFYLPLRATCNTIFGVNVDWVPEKSAVIVNSTGNMNNMPLY